MTIYKLIKSIGKGSFGCVFIVKHPLTMKKYAMKRIHTYNMHIKNKRDLLNELRILRFSLNTDGFGLNVIASGQKCEGID